MLFLFKVYHCEIVLVDWVNEAERDIIQSYHPYYLFVVCSHLEFGLCILEGDPVYCHSFQLKDHASNKI